MQSTRMKVYGRLLEAWAGVVVAILVLVLAVVFIIESFGPGPKVIHGLDKSKPVPAEVAP